MYIHTYIHKHIYIHTYKQCRILPSRQSLGSIAAQTQRTTPDCEEKEEHMTMCMYVCMYVCIGCLTKCDWTCIPEHWPCKCCTGRPCWSCHCYRHDRPSHLQSTCNVCMYVCIKLVSYSCFEMWEIGQIHAGNGHIIVYVIIRVPLSPLKRTK